MAPKALKPREFGTFSIFYFILTTKKDLNLNSVNEKGADTSAINHVNAINTKLCESVQVSVLSLTLTKRGPLE